MKLLLLLLPLAYGIKLQIIEAGVKEPWKKGPVLESTNVLCPADLFPKFSIECSGKPAKSAMFYIDGELFHTESVVPYVLSGDVGEIANPWDPPMKSVVKCELSNGESVEAEIEFSCDPVETPSPDKPTEMDPEMQPMPTMDVEDTMGPTTDAPTTTETTMAPTTTEPVTEAPPTTEAPSQGDDQQGGGGGGGGVKKTGTCTYIPATSYVTQKGWVKKDGGMGYKVNDDDMGIDGKEDAPMTFKFKAPITSRYAFTVDMFVADFKDHNDIWAKIDGVTWSMERPGSKKTEDGFIKVYHNDAKKRVTKGFNVDYDAHAISTKDPLKGGETYTVVIGGRSTKVVVYGIVLFPCEGVGCMIGDYWNSVVGQCQQ